MLLYVTDVSINEICAHVDWSVLEWQTIFIESHAFVERKFFSLTRTKARVPRGQSLISLCPFMHVLLMSPSMCAEAARPSWAPETPETHSQGVESVNKKPFNSVGQRLPRHSLILGNDRDFSWSLRFCSRNKITFPASESTIRFFNIADGSKFRKRNGWVSLLKICLFKFNQSIWFIQWSNIRSYSSDG